jgi:hypothetical protein
MTFMSFWLEVRNRGSGEKKLKQDLPAPSSGRVGPYGLRYWAEREGLQVEYIDNCWVKVPVDHGRLLAFLSELYSPNEPFPSSALPSLSGEWEFVLAAEEF